MSQCLRNKDYDCNAIDIYRSYNSIYVEGYLIPCKSCGMPRNDVFPRFHDNEGDLIKDIRNAYQGHTNVS